MSEKQKAKEGVLEDIIAIIYSRLRKNLVKELRKYIFDASKFLIKKIIVAIIGVLLIIFGVLFVCISLVKYTSIYVPSWMAWLGVGLAVLALGCVISIIMLKR